MGILTLRLPCLPPLVLLYDLIVLVKLEANAIHAMPLVCRRRVPFALEDMAEVAPAVGAHNLGAQHAMRAVLVPLHGARDAVEVGRPAAARLELVRGLVERRVTAGARVDAFLSEVLVVLAREGRLRTLLSQDAELLWLTLVAELVRICINGATNLCSKLPATLAQSGFRGTKLPSFWVARFRTGRQVTETSAWSWTGDVCRCICTLVVMRRVEKSRRT